MELKEAFNKAGNITIKLGNCIFRIDGTNLHIVVNVHKFTETFNTIVGVADMQNIPTQTLMGYGISMEHAEIIRWLCTRYVQDVYPEIA